MVIFENIYIDKDNLENIDIDEDILKISILISADFRVFHPFFG